jgi:hypothetical protein
MSFHHGRPDVLSAGAHYRLLVRDRPGSRDQPARSRFRTSAHRWDSSKPGRATSSSLAATFT